jgi:catechol 2,3-dioxygenase-like lactoylglutathione lyase family enzyme
MSTQPDHDPQLTHVSYVARDIEESAAFYESVLGCERLATPHLGRQEDFVADEDIKIQMMRIGPVQLHLWNDPAQPIEAVKFAHFGIHVADFEQVYRVAEERELFTTVGKDGSEPQVFDFNGTAQMYIQDPTGNLLEIDYPDISELDRSTFAKVITRETSGPGRHTYTDIDGQATPL